VPEGEQTELVVELYEVATDARITGVTTGPTIFEGIHMVPALEKALVGEFPYEDEWLKKFLDSIELFIRPPATMKSHSRTSSARTLDSPFNDRWMAAATL
jgi:hypothetical protein